MAKRSEPPFLGASPEYDPYTVQGRANLAGATFRVTGWRARALVGIFLFCAIALVIAVIT
jgi:hypothetical protein